MKKILIVFDGEHFPEEVMQYAERMNEHNPILLTGIFLPSVEYTNLIYYMGGMQGYNFTTLEDVEGDAKAIAANIERFKERCVQQGLEHRVHSSMSGTALNTIVRESRFADLLLLGGDKFFTNLSEHDQQVRMDDTAEMAECPVLIIPDGYGYPESVILAYDGSESSVYAIKQFAYILPELAKKNTTMIYVAEEGKEFPHFDNIKELAARHYPNLDFNKVDANPGVYFNTWVQNENKSLLVAGSYARGAISKLFKKSFVKELVHNTQIPIFIAHK